MYEFLKIEKRKKWTIVKLNRPKVNALNVELLSEIRKCMKELEKDDSRCIILTGEGDNFCAGADIKVMKEFNSIQAREFALNGQMTLSVIENLEKPVIAVIQGFALGGGCEIALACDIRVAAKDAQIGQPEVKIGLIPGFAGTQRLSRIIGIGKAKELIYTGEAISGEEAYRIGLVQVCADKEKILETAEKIAEKISLNGPESIRLVKSVINRGLDSTFTTATSYEAESFGLVFSTGEPYEGISAFLEKRRPKWQEG